MDEKVLAALEHKEKIQDALIEAVRAELVSDVIPGMVGGSYPEREDRGYRKADYTGGVS